MIRRLFTVASAISLLLCAVTAMFWVRSYWVGDAIGRSTLNAESLRYTCPMIVLAGGRITVSRTVQHFDRESFALWAAELRESPSSIKPGLWHQHGGTVEYHFQTPWERFKLEINRVNDVDQPYQGWHWFWASGELHRQLRTAGRYSETTMSIGFSCGYVVVLCFIGGFPAMLSLRRGIRERRSPGLCRHCGYDLRASIGRCPECGAPIQSKREIIA